MIVNRAISRVLGLGHFECERRAGRPQATPEIADVRLWLSRRLRAENAVEAFAVLQEDQNPQHASDQRGCDAARAIVR